MNLRKITVLAALAAALAVVPAQAMASSSSLPEGVYVCNSAHAGSGGTLDVLAGGDFADPQGGLKTDTALTAMRGGNLNAAMHSKALALCGLPADTTAGWGGSGG